MSQAAAAPATSLTLNQGRLLILLAAILWSLSGGFTKILTQNVVVHFEAPPVTGIQIAFYRIFFAGLVLTPTLRRADFTFRRPMIAMVICFAIMNATFVLAMAWGKAANAILLQYSAPLWMYLASVYWLGEAADRRSSVALVAGLVGIGVIIWGGWQDAEGFVVMIALASGVTYAGVIMFLRILRDCSPRLLTFMNNLGGALVLIPVLFYLKTPVPGPGQLGILFVFGAVQMCLPYFLMARGLRVVSPQEAGAITLLEPLLNPIWAYLVAPETEAPGWYTYVGGAFILGGLMWRYWPQSKLSRSRVPEKNRLPP